ncbi:MAG: glycosyl hydrolase 108 family protein, partial [Janthinobacterium sp.]
MATMENPLIASVINAILRAEGGYVNDPLDAGGETNFGITVAVARANGYKGAMRDMPEAVARAI